VCTRTYNHLICVFIAVLNCGTQDTLRWPVLCCHCKYLSFELCQPVTHLHSYRIFWCKQFLILCCSPITCSTATVRLHHMKPVPVPSVNKNYLQCRCDVMYRYFCTDCLHNDCESLVVLTVKVLNCLLFVCLMLFTVLRFAPSVAHYSSYVIDT
jgi:hypothetical protein